MGLFDNMKKKSEAKQLGLSVEQYDEYIEASKQGLTLDQYKRYLASFSTRLNLNQFFDYLRLEKIGMTDQQITRYISELSSKIKVEDYADFLEAEKLGLSLSEYIAYSNTLKGKMTAVDYVGFLKAQKIGFTLGKYLQYLKSFKEEMTLDEYSIYLQAESHGMDREHYSEYLKDYKDKFSVERYLEFDKARSLGMTLEEYDLRIEASKSGMSMEQFKNHKEAEKLGMSDEEYSVYLDLLSQNVIIDDVITIPDSLTELPQNVFKQFSFKKIVFNTSLEKISDNAFEGCESLVELVLPNSIKAIGENAFSKCGSLQRIVLCEGLEEIGDGAFSDCISLKEAYIPGTVKNVGYHAFNGCSTLEKLEFEFGVESIDVSEWTDLPCLKTVITPATASIHHLPPFRNNDARYGIINRDRSAYMGSETKIDYVNPGNYSDYGIEEHRDEIEYLEIHGDYVFLDLANFANLKTVEFSAKGSIRSVKNCPALQMILYNNFTAEIPSGFVSTEQQREQKIIDSKTFDLNGINAPSLSFIGIDDGAMVVDLDNADGFNLKWLHIPACCSRIGINTPVISSVCIHGNCKVSSYHLNNTSSMSIIRFDKDAREGGVYSNTTAKSILPAELSKCDLIDIRFGISTIKAEQFGSQEAVKAINLPQNVTVISDNAFEGWGIESITIPDTVEAIGNNVFMDCKHLKHVVLAKRPVKIGSDLFEGCDQLESIEIGGIRLSASEFKDIYEDKSTARVSIDEASEQVNEAEEIADIEVETADDNYSTADFEESTDANDLVATPISFANDLKIILPDSYIFSTDTEVIGNNRVLVAVLNDDNADLSNPYGATESVTVLFGKTLGSIDESSSIANSIGITGGKTIIDNENLNVRYELKESGEDLTIFLALICTQSNSYPAQFFFNNNNKEKENIVESILGSISYDLSNQACNVDEVATIQDESKKTIHHPVETSTSSANKSAIIRTISKDVPEGVLYRPGEEPDRIRQRIERLFEKLDEAYPDKIIVGLHKDHKKWGETVTELYRQLGYPDGNAFLNAYGYTTGVGASGRPSSNPMEVINELKRRYADGATCDKIADLAAENPDLAPKFKNLQNQADKFFGMSLVKYFIQEGILVGKVYTSSYCEDEFESLRSRYAGKPFTGTLLELKHNNSDIDWNAINRFYSKSGSTQTFKEYLINQGILVEQETSVEAKLIEIAEELKKRYPEGKKFAGTIDKLKSDNNDLSISSINAWAMQVHGITAREYLVQQGIMEEAKSAEDKLLSVIETLKERYSSGEKKAYTLTDLREQNLDLPISTIGTWTKKIYGKNASEYLSEQGILSEYDWMASMRQENERREAAAKALEEKLAAEMAAPITTKYYEPPVYYVEDYDVTGEEVKDWKYKDNYFNHIGEIFIEDYLGNKDCITIPTSINGKRVTNLDSFALKTCKASTIRIPGSIKHLAGHLGYQNENIKAVIVGEGMETIGESCFSFVKNLKDVKVSRSVIRVGDSAFKYTPWYEAQEDLVIIGSVLTEMKQDHAVLNVPEGIKTVGRLVAVFKSNLRKVILPNTVTTLCESAFSGRGNENIREFIFTDSLTNIGLHAFGFNKWTDSFKDQPIIINNQLYQFKVDGNTVVIPEGVTKICSEVFKESKDLKTVVFPKTLKSIGEQAFAECQSLTTINLPEGVERLEKACFYNCRKLSKVSVPDSLIEVGRSAFNSCHALTEITLGRNVEEIGEKAFYDCRMLRSVSLNKNVKRILPEAFCGCSVLNQIELPADIEEIGKNAFYNCASLERIVVPEGVKIINSSTFSGCKNLRDVILPEELIEIADSAFSGCTELTDITLPQTIGQQAFSGCLKLKRAKFVEGAKVITKNCFSGNSSLEEVIIPDSVETIEEGAFCGCVSLKDVVLPKALKSIGKSAFCGCSTIQRISIPETVNTIGDNAFKDCTSLSDVSMSHTIENFGLDVFTNSPYMKKEFGDFVIMGGVLSKYLGTEKNITIPESVTSIGENAFAEAYHVETIIIPDNVKNIANKLFGVVYTWGDKPKPQLRSVVIGNGVTSIGDEAFANCEKLTEVQFGSGITTIGQKAFAGCKELKKIDLSKTEIAEIKQEAFSNCYNVKELVLPKKIEIIGRSAFSGISLGVVKLPKTVRKVERSAFENASELIVYDTIDPDAVDANEWKHDKWNGSVNSALSCAMLGVPQSYVECQGNTRWRGYHITVLSADTETIRYRIFCDSEERDEYRAIMFSAWGKNASFTFEPYDDYFMKTRNAIGRTEMAFCRMQYPEGLNSAHRAYYEAFLERCMYIERSAKRTSEIIGNEDAVERLMILDNYKAIDNHNIGWIREIMENKKAKKCLAYLDEHYSK